MGRGFVNQNSNKGKIPFWNEGYHNLKFRKKAPQNDQNLEEKTPT